MKTLGFLFFFRCQFEIFFNLKTAIISSKKTTGQQTRSLLTLFNIPIYEVCRKFDKNCIETLKIGKFCVFVIFGFNLIFFFVKTAIISSEKPTGQRFPAMLRVFNILIHDVRRKKDKNCMKTLKIGKSLNFCHSRGHFGSLWGHFRHSQKSPKISINTFRTKINLRELNSMGKPFKVNITFVLGNICKKNPFDLNIFLSHMKFGRKITKGGYLACLHSQTFENFQSQPTTFFLRNTHPYHLTKGREFHANVCS